MGFATKMANGWQVAKNSMAVLNAHKELIVFPILSGVIMLAIGGSFFSFMVWGGGSSINDTSSQSTLVLYSFVFLLYIIGYFITVFFNMALMHCAKLYFDGEEVSVGKGLSFSAGRVKYIFMWAVFAATVGTVLRMIQDNLGWLGKILIGLVGIVWSASVFFVVPVLASEDLGPLDALKRSAGMMKERWGEGLSANFSLGLITAGAILVVAVVGMGISAMVNEQLGIMIMVAGILLIVVVAGALHSIAVSAIYNEITGSLNQHFNKQLLDTLFVEK